jgi:hypothetical protein
MTTGPHPGDPQTTRRRRRRPEDAPQPWDIPPADEYDIRAVKALAAGVASDGQQKRALDWIIRCAAGTYDLSFRPGVDGHRATDFSEGKRFVGLQLVRLVNMKMPDKPTEKP